MSNLTLFLKKNKKTRENKFYAPTKSLLDENGEPLKWEFRHVPTKEIDKITEGCTIEVQVTGKPGMYRPKVNNTKFIEQLIIKSTVVPDLYNAELQDSYGVMTPEALLKEMVDDPVEYNSLAEFVKNFGGDSETLSDKVEAAKN